MAQTACWMFNTLDICGWIGFGYGSHFDTRQFWISHAGLMHLAKFHDFEMFMHAFGHDECTPVRHVHDCAYSRSVVNWKKLMKQSAINISIPGHEELEELWFKNFYAEVENYKNNNNLPWSFDGDHWKYHGWQSIQKFGNDWV
jgi:hypothetical protein